jgi:hypothetical protein
MVMNNFIFLHVTADRPILAHRLTIRGDEFISLIDLVTIEEEYDKFFKATSILSAKVDTSNISPNLLLHQCLSLIQGVDIHFRNSVQLDGEFIEAEEEDVWPELEEVEEFDEFEEEEEDSNE